MNCVKLDDKGSTKSDRIVRTKLSTPNNRAPARYVRVQRTEPANFHQLANTHIHDVRVPRTRSKLHGKGNRGTARIVVELPSRSTAPTAFLTALITFFLFFSSSLWRSPLSILLYFFHRPRCAPRLLFLNQREQHFLFPVIIT